MSDNDEMKNKVKVIKKAQQPAAAPVAPSHPKEEKKVVVVKKKIVTVIPKIKEEKKEEEVKVTPAVQAVKSAPSERKPLVQPRPAQNQSY